MREEFDQAYYERYYSNPRTRSASPTTAARQADFIASYLRYLEVPVRRIVDIGCGLGRVLERLRDHYPSARAVGVEFSDYLCETYGWEAGSVVNWAASRPFDLVVCNDVLAYLSDRDCARGINNLARLSRAALFIGVLTREDWALCDTERTDHEQYLRPKEWYQKRLGRHFVNVGGGLWLKKPLAFPVWTLDRLN